MQCHKSVHIGMGTHTFDRALLHSFRLGMPRLYLCSLLQVAARRSRPQLHTSEFMCSLPVPWSRFELAALSLSSNVLHDTELRPLLEDGSSLLKVLRGGEGAALALLFDAAKSVTGTLC